MIRILAPWGFYGWGNTGDEGTLNGFARLLALEQFPARVTAESRNPEHTARVEPALRYYDASRRDVRRWWGKLRSTAHAVIGGTPIMDVLGDWPLSAIAPLVRSAARWRVPFVFIGCGVEELGLEASQRLVKEEIVPRAFRWSVRSERDRARLIQWGVGPDAITVAADVAWLIDPVSDEFGADRLRRWGINAGQPVIGVNVANENHCLERHPEMAEALAASLDTLATEINGKVLFLCAETREGPTFDNAAARQVIRRMRNPDRAVLAPNDYLAPRELMSLIDCCVLTLSMRYHFCLFSALQGVPFIAIRRADKVSDLCWDLDWKASLVPPQFDAGEIIEHGRHLMDRTEVLGAELAQGAGRMRARALMNIVPLKALQAP